MSDILFDDTYNGPRWTYGLKYRPIAGAGVPKGFIVYSDRPHRDYKFGTVDYPFPLGQRAEQADMVLVAVRPTHNPDDCPCARHTLARLPIINDEKISKALADLE